MAGKVSRHRSPVVSIGGADYHGGTFLPDHFPRGEPMRTLGRAMQFIGLTILPLSMIMQLTDMLGRSIGLSQMLVMMVFGAAIFYTGRMVEGLATRE
jgi:hypothetical protein